MAFDRLSTSSAELLQAAANTSAYFPASSKLPWKPLIVATSPADTVSRLPPSPAARFMDGASADAACSAFSPARAKFSVAVAASFIPKVELAAASFMALFRSSASSSVLPIVLLVSCMVLSTSAKLLAPAAPTATSGSVTWVVRSVPTAVILPPTSSNFLPTASILFKVSFASAASRMRFFSSCSVSTISLCRASYLSFPRSPDSSCCFACSWAVFKASSFSLVAPIFSFKTVCFCESSSVLVGSSFSSLLISFSCDWVLFMVELTPFNALSRPVVSPPISTVIPFILLPAI